MCVERKYTFKELKPMKKKIAILLTITTVLAGIFFLSRRNPDNTQNENLILSEYQLEPYLNIRGWKVTPLSSETIKIPQKFTGSFKVLADEMEKSGFDLESHKGEAVTRYTYSVDNYGESGITAELLVTSENELISAALIQQKPDGFIKSV